MRTINKIILTLLLIASFGATSVNAQCNYLVMDSANSYVPGSQIQFISTGSGTNFFWDFGDGNTSTQQWPFHAYATGGTYYYCLTIDSCPPVCDSITIGSVCSYTVASYVWNPNPFQHSFYGSQATGTIFFWDFGDGNFSSSPTPTHTYSAAGTYYYCLTVDSCPPVCDSLTIAPCNYSVWAYQDSLTNNINFYTSNLGGSTYFWDFGDGNTSTQQQPLHNYAAPGTYTYCLTIDSCPPVCGTITINPPCNNSASFTYVNNGNGNYSFTNTSSGNATYFYWNFGDGNTSTQTNPNHTYNANGPFVVQLIAYDSAGFCADYSLITLQVSGVLNPTGCLAAFVMWPDTNNNNNVIVYNTSTGNNITYFWDFGDGNTSTLQFPNYTYTSAGPFQICLTVDDGFGCVDTYCDSIAAGGHVFKQTGFTINVVPVASSSCNYTVFAQDSSCYAYFGSSAQGSTYFWDFGDGNTSTSASPVHLYSTSGSYYYCLTVDSCAPVCDSVTVSCPVGITDYSTTNVERIQLYPNPVKDFMNIEFSLIEPSHVDVFIVDLLGNKVSVVASQEMNTGLVKLTWKPSEIANGVYLLTIKTPHSLEVKKLVINR